MTASSCPTCDDALWLCDVHGRPRCAECRGYDGSESGCPRPECQTALGHDAPIDLLVTSRSLPALDVIIETD